MSNSSNSRYLDATLSEVVQLVRRLEDAIHKIRRAMIHSHLSSINVFRRAVNELEDILETIMTAEITSETDIEFILNKSITCVKECLKPFNIGPPVDFPPAVVPTPTPLPTPSAPIPPTPPEVPPAYPVTPTQIAGSNLILYLDATASMGTYYKKELGAELNRLAAYLKKQCDENNIPSTFSLVWFGDIMGGKSSADKARVIANNKEDISKLPAAVSKLKRLASGRDIPESGLWAINESLAQVVKPGVENTLIYVTDAASKPNDQGVTPDSVKSLMDAQGIKSRFAVLPTDKKPDVSSLFTEVRDIKDKSGYNMVPWGHKALHP